jgi:hypothetical protein
LIYREAWNFLSASFINQGVSLNGLPLHGGPQVPLDPVVEPDQFVGLGFLAIALQEH